MLSISVQIKKYETQQLNHQIEEKEILNTMSLNFTDLTTAVTAETTVEQSAITLIQQLAAAILESSSDQDEVETLATQLQSEASNLSAAVVANTPTNATVTATPATPATPATTPSPVASGTGGTPVVVIPTPVAST